MYRSALCSVLAMIAGFVPALAQDAEESWKSLVMQGLYYAGESQFTKAEAAFIKAVHESQRFGAEDARVGTTLNSLGLVYKSEKKFTEAEATYRKALAILDKAYGQETIDVANVNFNIATVLMDQQRHAAAMPYLQKTLQSYETLLGGTSVKTASVLCMMGESFRLSRNYPDAIKSFKRCADIREADGGIQNPELAEALRGTALTYAAQGRYLPAESNFKLAEKIVENTSGIASPQLAGLLGDHIAMLKLEGGRERDVQRLGKLAESIRRLQSSQTKKRPG